MTVSPYEGSGGGVQRSSGGALVDVIDTILDKGLVIDAYVRVSLVGIELLTVDARVVVASVDTYLRFAEAVDRLDLTEGRQKGLPGLIQDIEEGGAKSKTKQTGLRISSSFGSSPLGFLMDHCDCTRNAD